MLLLFGLTKMVQRIKKKKLVKKAKQDFAQDFIDLTKAINMKRNIKIEVKDQLNMVFNEYDFKEDDEKIIAENKAQTINNINIIIFLMKNMNRLYTEVKPIINKQN